jgi:hypothetical protein
VHRQPPLSGQLSQATPASESRAAQRTNLPQLSRHFPSVPHSEFLVPLIITLASVLIAALCAASALAADRYGFRWLLRIASLVFFVFGSMPFRVSSLYAVRASAR